MASQSKMVKASVFAFGIVGLSQTLPQSANVEARLKVRRSAALNDAVTETLDEVFKKYDVDRDGFLNKEELRNFFRVHVKGWDQRFDEVFDNNFDEILKRFEEAIYTNLN